MQLSEPLTSEAPAGVRGHRSYLGPAASQLGRGRQPDRRGGGGLRREGTRSPASPRCPHGSLTEAVPEQLCAEVRVNSDTHADVGGRRCA